jgi:phosphoglycolate phosphatase
MTQPLLVFDLDGTLAETAPDIVDALNIVLVGEGMPPVSYETARRLVGFGGRALIRDGLATGGVAAVSDAKIETMFNAFLAHYEAHIADKSHLYEGVEAALDRFADAGWHFAVCTNKFEHPAIQLLTRLGIASRFKAICGQNTFAVCKPAADALFGTIARAGGHPQATVMIGDSKTDIATARNANIPVVAVDFGYSDAPIADYAPDRIISHFDALWDAVAAVRNAIPA